MTLCHQSYFKITSFFHRQGFHYSFQSVPNPPFMKAPYFAYPHFSSSLGVNT